MREELLKILNLIVPATRQEIQERINDLDEGDESYEEYKSMLTRDEACDKILELFKQSSTDEKVREIKKWLNDLHTHYQSLKDLNALLPVDRNYWDAYNTVQQKITSIFEEQHKPKQKK